MRRKKETDQCDGCAIRLMNCLLAVGGMDPLEEMRARASKVVYTSSPGQSYECDVRKRPRWTFTFPPPPLSISDTRNVVLLLLLVVVVLLLCYCKVMEGFYFLFYCIVFFFSRKSGLLINSWIFGCARVFNSASRWCCNLCALPARV